METVALARHAMATRFEIVLHGPNAARLRGAGEEALAEVERIEAQLSIFRPSSEISRVNARAAHEAVRVSPATFRLLESAQQLHQESGGAFDITIAPLMGCWGFLGNSGSLADPADLAKARACTGMNHVHLDPTRFEIRFDTEGVMLDLGALGKGYAVDRAVEILREAGVDRALLHGGTSTVYGLGAPPDGEAWKIAVESPPVEEIPPWIATVPLCNEALSVSAVWGKFFTHEGKTLGHVLDPRLGAPVETAVLAAMVLPSATETDALSTALLAQGSLGRLRPAARALVVGPRSTGYRVEARGIEIKMRPAIEKEGKGG